MSNSVITAYTSGKNVYFVVLTMDGRYWTGSGFETKNNAHWVSYAQAMTENEFNYVGSFPTLIGAGLYYILAFERLGATPASNDKYIRNGVIDWDGSSEWSGGIASGGSAQVEFSIGTGVVKPSVVSTGVVDRGRESETRTGVL